MWTGVWYYMSSRDALSSLDVTKCVDLINLFDSYPPDCLLSSGCIPRITSMSSWVCLPTQSSKALLESVLGHTQLLYRPLLLLVSIIFHHICSADGLSSSNKGKKTNTPLFKISRTSELLLLQTGESCRSSTRMIGNWLLLNQWVMVQSKNGWRRYYLP